MQKEKQEVFRHAETKEIYFPGTNYQEVTEDVVLWAINTKELTRQDSHSRKRRRGPISNLVNNSKVDLKSN